MTDEIVLTLPRERSFHDVAHLVVAGLAARLDLTVDTIDDLQLVLAGLLPQSEEVGDVTLGLRLEGTVLSGRIGPFVAAQLRRELEYEGAAGYGLHHVLDTVFDAYRLEVENGSAWVEFSIGVTPGGGQP